MNKRYIEDINPFEREFLANQQEEFNKENPFNAALAVGNKRRLPTHIFDKGEYGIAPSFDQLFKTDSLPDLLLGTFNANTLEGLIKITGKKAIFLVIEGYFEKKKKSELTLYELSWFICKFPYSKNPEELFCECNQYKFLIPNWITLCNLLNEK